MTNEAGDGVFDVAAALIVEDIELFHALGVAASKEESERGAGKAIVDQYAYYRDCGSSMRVAQWIADVAQAAMPGAPRGY